MCIRNLLSTTGATQFKGKGVMATIGAGDFKDTIITVLCLFGGILVLRGIATLSEGQGENNAAAKAQGWGLVGGGIVLIIGGMAVVETIFKNI